MQNRGENPINKNMIFGNTAQQLQKTQTDNQMKPNKKILLSSGHSSS